MIKFEKAVTTSSPEETRAFARSFAESLKVPSVICLYGDLGAGKTTFVKGLASAFGLEEKHIKSPTFVLLHEYEGYVPLYHFDFYRLSDGGEDCCDILSDILERKDGIVVIEWPERLEKHLPKDRISLYFTHESEMVRLISNMPDASAK
jgi:tRNA threonylcarbamoyladenosine biosynthesis protein TsaE